MFKYSNAVFQTTIILISCLLPSAGIAQVEQIKIYGLEAEKRVLRQMSQSRKEAFSRDVYARVQDILQERHPDFTKNKEVMQRFMTSVDNTIHLELRIDNPRLAELTENIGLLTGGLAGHTGPIVSNSFLFLEKWSNSNQRLAIIADDAVMGVPGYSQTKHVKDLVNEAINFEKLKYLDLQLTLPTLVPPNTPLEAPPLARLEAARQTHPELASSIDPYLYKVNLNVSAIDEFERFITFEPLDIDANPIENIENNSPVPLSLPTDPSNIAQARELINNSDETTKALFTQLDQKFQTIIDDVQEDIKVTQNEIRSVKADVDTLKLIARLQAVQEEKIAKRNRLIQDLQAIDQAGQAVARAYSLFSDDPRRIKEVQQGSMILSAGVQMAIALAPPTTILGAASAANIALGLATSLQDQGPSADMLILDGLRRLSEQVENLRQEMHERFDQVDVKLDSVIGLSHSILNEMQGHKVQLTRLQNMSLEIVENMHSLEVGMRIYAIEQLIAEDLIIREVCRDPAANALVDTRDAQRCYAAFLIFSNETSTSPAFSGAGLPTNSSLHQNPYFNINQIGSLLQREGIPQESNLNQDLPNPWAWYVGTRQFLDFMYNNAYTWSPISRDIIPNYPYRPLDYTFPAVQLPQILSKGEAIQQATRKLAQKDNRAINTIIQKYKTIAESIQDSLEIYWKSEFTQDFPHYSVETEQYDINPWLSASNQFTTYEPKLLTDTEQMMPYCVRITAQNDHPF